MAIDHTNCTHPRTPAGRRACRASQAVVPQLPDDDVKITPPAVRRKRVADLQEKLMKAADEPRRIPRIVPGPDTRPAKHPRRMQRDIDAPVLGQPYVPWPKGMSRKGYRSLVKRAGECPQVELHIDAHGGSCACGWKASKLAR